MEPVHLAIFNDSHKHAHHKPMAGNTNPETHFRLEIVSNYFEGKVRFFFLSKLTIGYVYA